MNLPVCIHYLFVGEPAISGGVFVQKEKNPHVVWGAFHEGSRTSLRVYWAGHNRKDKNKIIIHTKYLWLGIVNFLRGLRSGGSFTTISNLTLFTDYWCLKCQNCLFFFTLIIRGSCLHELRSGSVHKKGFGLITTHNNRRYRDSRLLFWLGILPFQYLGSLFLITHFGSLPRKCHRKEEK